MKLIFNDSSELSISRLNRTIYNNSGTTDDTLYITIAKSVDFDTLKTFSDKVDWSEMTLSRTGYDDITISGYTLESISENIDESSGDINVNLTK